MIIKIITGYLDLVVNCEIGLGGIIRIVFDRNARPSSSTCKFGTFEGKENPHDYFVQFEIAAGENRWSTAAIVYKVKRSSRLNLK